MNALRRYVTSTDGNILLKVPVEYIQRRLEVIILPADDQGTDCTHEARLQEAHQVIDEGGDIDNSAEFLTGFEQSRRDRQLPFRD